MKFYNKAQTLEKLKPKNASIPQLMIIKTSTFFKNKQNIFLEKNRCINFANKNKIFILVK